MCNKKFYTRLSNTSFYATRKRETTPRIPFKSL